MRRVSSRSWYRSTRFDTTDQNVIYQKCQVPDLARRVRHGLAFLITGSVLFLAYFIWLDRGGDGSCTTRDDGFDNQDPTNRTCGEFSIPQQACCGQMPQLIWISILLFLSIVGIVITQVCSHAKLTGQDLSCWILTHHNLQIIGGLLVLIFAVTNWVYAAKWIDEPTMSFNRHLASWVLHIQVTLLLYTCVRLPILFLIIIGMLNSIIFEVLLHVSKDNVPALTILAEVFLIVAAHFICAKHCLQTDDDLYLTYQGVLDLVRKSTKLEGEKNATRVLINSLVPASLTTKIMEELELPTNQLKAHQMRKIVGDIDTQDNVTILFADIVGFTRLSSGLEAVNLVKMLNDLFGRFDFLCDKMNCEKVATLGDCYYCVSGCPQPDDNHAYNCVKMGIKICKTIKTFCVENNVAIESARRHKEANPEFEGQIVDMRVGVHSGRVIYGIVGSKRYKFDVYSQDVHWANKLESTGVPGRVHISGCTRGYLRPGDFELEDGDPRIENNNGIARPIEEWERLFAENEVNLKSRFEQIFENKEIKDMEVDRERCSQTTWLVIDNTDRMDMEFEPEVTGNGTGNGIRHTVIEDSTQVALIENGTGSITDASDDMPRPTAIHIINPSQKSSIEMARIEHNAESHFQKRDETSRKELNPFTLNFVDDNRSVRRVCSHSCQEICQNLNRLEEQYRDGFQYRRSGIGNGNCQTDDYENTFPLARFRKDIVLCIVTQALLYFAVLLSMGYDAASLITFLICFVLSGLFLLAVTSRSLKERVGPRCLTWIWRHVIGAFLLVFPSLPAIVASFNVECNTADCDSLVDECQIDYRRKREMLVAVLSASALHHTNFSNLSSNMRSFIAFLILVISFCISAFYMDDCESSRNQNFQWSISLFLLLLLILLENRSYEISHRLNFKAKVQTKAKRRQLDTHAKYAKNILTNIIPEHVIQNIQEQRHYSKDHPLVGVFFATITNFLVLYEEQFKAGEKFIVVLSELISDIDELLERHQYSRSIEKIKTTSATYMGASGLTADDSDDDEHHLEKMIEFCLDIQKTVEAFSQNMVWFEFKLRIGAHCGEVTAGVMGTQKLLFDIWGNTVNVASRMDSTGICGNIQITEDLKNQLSSIREKKGSDQRYAWNPRGKIFVKGKGMIKTYLLEKETNL